MHGGNGRTKAKAATTLATSKAAAKVALFGARKDIEPGAALLELVQWTAGEVDFWRQEVRLIERDDLTWGVTREKSGGEDFGTTTEAKPALAYVMLTAASDRLARYCVEAIRAGIDERRVQIAESQGALVAEAIRRILQDLGLSPDQESRVAEVVPRHLRALGGGSER